MPTSIMPRSSWPATAVALGVLCLSVAAAAPGQRPGRKTRSAKTPAQSQAAEPSTTEPSTKIPELTAEDLDIFLDGFMPQQLEHADIAGAVIAVVKSGKLLFAKGYGYSDYARKVPVSPENTLFRPGSISKLFTWTCVMQQVELGKLDLDRDVNDYLDFKIPPAFGKPITLRDIMTHRPGFEETIKDLFVGSQKDLQPLARYLPSHLPARIFPPGTTPAYSNYATTLAAYIVERVTGQAFDDYVEAHILKPLGMEHATFRQPLPPALQLLMSNGYQRASGGAKGFEYVEVAPAGALSTSAEAITHFMIAHLQNGRYGDVQILKPETAVQMHQRQPGWPAAMNAMCLGFYEESRNGQRIIGHGGDTEWFHSDLHLLLDANVGFFVSYNSAGRGEVRPRSELFDKFMERYFPQPLGDEPQVSSAAQDARRVAGVYETSRRFETNLLAFNTLLEEVRVTRNSEDNTISLPGFLRNSNGQPMRFREVSPMLFRNVNGRQKIAFVTDASGRRMAYIDFPFMVLQQVQSPLDRKVFNYGLLWGSLGVIALALVSWPAGAILRRHYGKPLELSEPARRVRMAMHAVCIITLIFAVCGILLFNALGNVGALGGHGDILVHLVQSIGVLCGVGAVLVVYGAVKSWRDATQWRWYKIWNTAVAAACVGFFWFVYYWHLLNFRLNY